MDDERAGLIVSLCAQAGMIMEDTSTLAVTLQGCPHDRIGETLRHLEAEVAATAALIAAARTLHARG